MGETLLLTQPELLIILLQAFPLSEPSLLRACRLLLFQPLRGTGGRSSPRRWRVRPRDVHGHLLLIKNPKHLHPHDTKTREEGRGPLTVGASGRITNNQRSSLLCGTNLTLIAHLALIVAYSGGRRSCSSREHASDVGLAASLISKMRSSLSMRGTIAGGGGWRGPMLLPARCLPGVAAHR
jgi:hypothetical protein